MTSDPPHAHSVPYGAASPDSGNDNPHLSRQVATPEAQASVPPDRLFSKTLILHSVHKRAEDGRNGQVAIFSLTRGPASRAKGATQGGKSGLLVTHDAWRLV